MIAAVVTVAQRMGVNIALGTAARTTCPEGIPAGGVDVTVDQIIAAVAVVWLAGGWIMERLAGFQRAILIDSMQTGEQADGKVSVFPLHALSDPLAGHTSSAHDTSLLMALRAGVQLGMDLPETITVVAIEAAAVHDFSEELSPAVAAAVPAAVQAVLDLLVPR